MIVSRRRPSPRRPRIGEATAPVIRVTVKDHCAVLIDVWKSRATVTSRGATEPVGLKRVATVRSI
jgi:hypothetical protein